MELSEQLIIQRLSSGDLVTYEKVYKTYYNMLYSYAYTMLKNELLAEEVVQSLFLKLWEKKETISIQTSLKAYLYRSVYNACLNMIKHEKTKQQYQQHAVHDMKHTPTDNPHQFAAFKNLEVRLRQALNELPEQCRTVFQLSRFEELKYREIAERLQISEKTVEHHMGKALKQLRIKLADFLVTTIIIFHYIKNGIN